MSNETIIVTDGNRKIAIKQPSAVEKMRIFKILPRGCDEKLLYVSMAFVAASTRRIDDKPMPFPQMEEDFEFIIDMLGDSGVDAVQKSLAPDPAGIDARAVETAAGN